MNFKHLIIIGLIIGLGWFAYSNVWITESIQSYDSSIFSSSPVTLLSAHEYVESTRDNDYFLIDVHTPVQTHIPGTNAVIPYDQIQSHLSQLPDDKSTPILVYCRTGRMSAQASAEIFAMGYTNVYDLKGGTDAYKLASEEIALWPITQSLDTVIYGEITQTDFTLTNYTPQPISITRLSTSCGCTKAEASSETIEPYESIQVSVTFDPAVHQDDSDVGQVTRTIYLETDHPEFAMLEANITANVIKQ